MRPWTNVDGLWGDRAAEGGYYGFVEVREDDGGLSVVLITISKVISPVFGARVLLLGLGLGFRLLFVFGLALLWLVLGLAFGCLFVVGRRHVGFLVEGTFRGRCDFAKRQFGVLIFELRG